MGDAGSDRLPDQAVRRAAAGEVAASGTFVYDPASGSTPSAGEHTLSATFEPDDKDDFRPATVTTRLVVRKAKPVVEWQTPAAVAAGARLGADQLDATASVPGAFAYDPAAGTMLDQGTQKLKATFEPDDSANTRARRRASSRLAPAAAGRPAPADDEIDGERHQGRRRALRVAGKGLKPDSQVTVYVRSTPQLIGRAHADAAGVLSTRVRLPAGLAAGAHHIEVRGTSAAGVAIVKLLPFTVAADGRLGSVGEIPDGPYAKLVPYRPAAHVEAVVAIGIASFALLGALGAALGNRGGSRSGGGKGGGSEDAFLEDVEVDRETEDGSGGGRGDRSEPGAGR